MTVLDAEQKRNAALIYQIGKQMGMSNRDIQIGLITAMQESSLRNLSHGDRDSLGLFQQRPSQGWGSAEQVTNPRYAATKFFSELRKVGNRDSMSMTQAAQAVQRSAYPDAYAKHVPLVRNLWPELVQARPGTEPSTYSKRKGNRAGEDDFDALPSAPELGAAWNPMLSAPDFWVEPDPTALNPTPTGAYFSPLNDDTFEQIKDAAAASGGFRPAKGVDGWRAAVIELAREHLGTPYVWGGTTPDGFDCSGLLQYVYDQVGINLPRISYMQANYGKRTGVKNLRPGDLVAWDNATRNPGADHIAMYIGNGKIIEAPRPGGHVRVRKLGENEGAWGVRIEK